MEAGSVGTGAFDMLAAIRRELEAMEDVTTHVLALTDVAAMYRVLRHTAERYALGMNVLLPSFVHDGYETNAVPLRVPGQTGTPEDEGNTFTEIVGALNPLTNEERQRVLDFALAHFRQTPAIAKLIAEAKAQGQKR